jgi:hypothetical protein
MFRAQQTNAPERIMFEAKVGNVPVVTRKKLLVGTIDMEAIAEEKRLTISGERYRARQT